MDSLGLAMGIVVTVMGIVYLFMGLRGKWIVLKRADEERPEEEKLKKIRQIRRTYAILGAAAFILGIIGILAATVWKP
jgi:Na+-transporting methylmalonyl-CoA/oxaloacetate decarboxylase gamma subunit